MPAKVEKDTVTNRLEKSMYTPVPKKEHLTDCANYHTISLTSHARLTLGWQRGARRLNSVPLLI